MAGKWNYATHEYDDYNPSFELTLFTRDLSQLVHCASCGSHVEYGQCYTSKEIHNHVGLGYPVCAKCYKTEIARYKKSLDN